MRFRFFLTREGVLVGSGLAILSIAAFHMPVSAGSTVPARPLASAGYSGSVSGSYVLGADNTNGSNPFNDYGVEGKVDNDVGGVGVLGYGQQAKSYGVYGVTFGLNGIGVYGAGIAATPAPDATPNSSNVTTGIAGDSHSGDGIFGSTEWGGFSNSFTNPVAGVVGVDDASTGQYNDGVFGMTAAAGYGVAGLGGNGSLGGVGAMGVNADGVDASSDSEDGVYATSQSNNGVEASSQSGFGIFASSQTGTAIYGYAAASGANTEASAGFFRGGEISILAQSSATTSDPAQTAYAIYTVDAKSDPLFNIDNVGNTQVYGELFLRHGQTTFARTRTAGTRMREYSPTMSRPTVEDLGQGQILNGAGYVRLDAAFANSIDDRSPYLVFVTPLGDTKGLFVTQRSTNGFTVRENQGGRSSVAFSYRVVATQYGESQRTMAAVRETDLDGMQRRYSGAREVRNAGEHRTAKFRKSVIAGAPAPARFFIPRPNFSVEHRQP